MDNRDFGNTDRNRSRLFEGMDDDFGQGGAPVDRGGYPPLRRPYPDRQAPSPEPYPPRYGVRNEIPPMPDYAANGNVNLFSPKSYADVKAMIDMLRRKESVIVNLEKIDAASAQRILDFLSGAAYAIGGSMRRVEDKRANFLVTPSGTGITDTNANHNH